MQQVIALWRELTWPDVKYYAREFLRVPIDVNIRKLEQWLKCKLHLCQECEHCETWVCWMCFRRVPWSNGAADDMPDLCDECWSAAHLK
jgi:hypothetical protein